MSEPWNKQLDKPLFPNIFWEAPLNRNQAKKLLIVGGHAKQFAETVGLYSYAMAAGIGSAKVVLPDSLRKLIGSQPDCLFVESNPSGSISKNSATEILAYASECDGVIFSSELSHNTETISLLETLFTEISKPIFFSSNVLEMLTFQPNLVLNTNKILVSETKNFMKFANTLKFPITIKAQSSIINKVELITSFTNEYGLGILLAEDPIITAFDSQICVTEVQNTKINIPEILAITATFWIQHDNKFEALTSAAYKTQHNES